ncbi:acetyl-CoA C-acyltransferase [Legionella longbeachae]|uniref:acetyl-CoA C-acyltransferase n=1 Tax=Legionella longbeachae serogroup 1 (strain NSW150) TaxID=661367 RepID=D3HJY7_LEGLN|nr:acetyl-CoA C-acyltransferase [Legionella longbeachae]VEE03267.1 3-ketoacyl-CoA thiolase [Legionella oakridgensis]HBD7398561.1 acetyl-CoA C-acyltransferase [Legionella pneumophila]ARB93835.1 acetyl-CoA acetyltransferase [Legionella longbeachae]ARM33025.1 acetyl-CoA C-acyltransferase [Legionella longbeachae]EEZ94142.1 3-ketoacyl-CoA thiolase [Legionella longbeachae D-4968]
MTNVYIVDVLRTPVGKAPRGVFKHTLPDDLLAHVIRNLMQRNLSVEKSKIEDVIIGCAMPEAEQGMNVARIASLLADLPQSVPAMTINRFCCSGVQSISIAADSIRSGDVHFALAGGVESMSMVPLGGNKYTANPAIFNNEDIAIAYGMGITAENVAKRWGISREQQDEFATESHKKAVAAQQRGDFKAEISPIEITIRHADLENSNVLIKKKLVSEDEGPRADTSYEAISKLKPVFAARGTVTAGNSSQTSDGAGIALLASEQALHYYKLKPIGRLLSYAVAGVPPEIMGIGPIEAIPIALKRAGITLDQLDWIELNEAFAAQALAVIKELDLPRDKVNPLGGAIALGHPLGATGAIRTATLLHGLQRTKGRYGMVTMCIGTGMGAAAIFEAL